MSQMNPEAVERMNGLIDTFVETNQPYYRRVFGKMMEAPGYRMTVNWAAALLGPIWFGARGLWSWFLGVLVLETLAYIQIGMGLFGDLGRDLRLRAESIGETLALRREQIAAAEESGSGSLDALKRAAEALEVALVDAQAASEAAAASGITFILVGLVLLAIVKGGVAVLANWTLEGQFARWRSDRSVASGWSMTRAAIASGLMGLVVVISVLKFSRPDAFEVLNTFPTNRDWRLNVGDGVQAAFDWTKTSGRGFFDALTFGMRSLLDAIEVVLVGTPWPVVALVIIMLAYLSAGPRVAIFTGAALAYLGLLDFWEKAMTTVALLGAAALISITLGIPLGIYCARRPKVFSVIRPILDFMQSMPSFVYLIPVVAFIGSGKPAGVVATMIFGSPPVIRFTVLGLQQVPETVREAALAFGATPRYLLWRVDLPLAAKTIMAGVNQTILLSLAMVVVASLIGAKGLGEDVLEALQFAAAGQGILAGLAILFCALILDRIVAGRN
ncbi:ABC transporter permease [Pontivivens insulae]|uniref:Glycine betaine transport system permease protein OpuAB n=1 Tax=Pontivivens insulae TaxID=1639689 RepID=A0A2R8A6V0_9RHOB|nr:ABC transporter permease subunit [Pontivivens insulae]RED18062.1 glycine betaine/proline transport system permease protein [Pontivivens insulae]SPF27959.1 Glycine betaine transport system permease protein OpuAB [Pontivivens insulae]